MALELAPNGITVRATQSKEFYEGNQRHILNEKEYYVVLSTRDFFETKTNILENDHKIVPDLSHIVTTFVETMNLAFCGRKDLNDDISNWDTSNVRSMSWMFQGAYNFNQDISAWDTSNVKSMYQMFMGAKKFNQDLSKWDIRSVQNMDHMFAYASPLSTIWKPSGNPICLKNVARLIG